MNLSAGHEYAGQLSWRPMFHWGRGRCVCVCAFKSPQARTWCWESGPVPFSWPPRVRDRDGTSPAKERRTFLQRPLASLSSTVHLRLAGSDCLSHVSDCWCLSFLCLIVSDCLSFTFHLYVCVWPVLSVCPCPPLTVCLLLSSVCLIVCPTVPALSSSPAPQPAVLPSKLKYVCVHLKIVVRRLTQRMWDRNYNLSQLYWWDQRRLQRSKQLLKYPANTGVLHISNQS